MPSIGIIRVTQNTTHDFQASCGTCNEWLCSNVNSRSLLGSKAGFFLKFLLWRQRYLSSLTKKSQRKH